MKNLVEYLNILESATESNKERKHELEKWLKDKGYADYITTLNRMLEDPKARTLLLDGFGGELGDTKLNFSVVNIPASNLIPTQNEIDVQKSVDFTIKVFPKTISKVFQNSSSGVEIVSPIITFRKNFVIDGHHRWSQIFAINPDAKIKCINYDGNISPIKMLKAVQGSIAAVIADPDNDNEGKDNKIPQSTVDGQNLFDKKWDRKKVSEYLNDNMSDECVSEFTKYVDKVSDKESAVKYMTDCLLELKYNNVPIASAPQRGDMPQTNKGGTDASDKKTAEPDKEGSALYKLKHDKFVKGAVQ